jgi:hypothetical protein
MGDYFVASGYLEDLENTVTVDALNGDIAVADSISASNVSSSNININSIFLESYSLATTLTYTSNLLGSNIQTTQLNSQNATINNLTFTGASGSNLVVTDLSAGLGDFYDVQTSVLSASNASVSNLFAQYADATTILGSNVYILSQLLDRSNVPIIDSNSKIDWASLKNIPESNGLDILALAQGAYDLAQLGYDMYQQLRSLLGNTPKLPDNIKDPVSEALGSNNSSNPIYVDWSKLTSRPISTVGTDLGVKTNLFLSDLSKVYRIPTGNFSTNNGNLYNTATSCNLLIDMTTETLYPQAISMGSNQLSTSSAQFGPVIMGSSGISTVSNVSLNIASAMIAPSMTINSNVSAQFISVSNITNQIYTSNLSNAVVPLTLASSCNLVMSSCNYLQLTSCNLNVSQSNLTWIQQSSNPNPFQTPYATTGVSLNNSNIVLKNLQSNQTTLFIQDPAAFKMLFSTSNGSNVINKTVQIDSNQNLTGLCNILLTGEIQNSSIYTSTNSLVVNSNLSTGKDVSVGGVVRTNVIQLGTCGLPVTGSYTPGIYEYNGKLLFSKLDSMVLGDMASGVVNMPSLTPAGYTKTFLANSFFNF